jgi:hypothetical protein
MGSGVILPEIVVTDHNVEWWKLNEIPVTLNDFLYVRPKKSQNKY